MSGTNESLIEAKEQLRALYECTNFVRENPDVIAVSIGYRISVFGFFRLSHLPDGKSHIWPIYEPENREIMVFDEFNIYTEKEAERQLVDWNRTYFLTRYYNI